MDDNVPAGDLIEEGNSSIEVIDAGQGRIVFTTDGTEIMRITHDGLIGINNDTPDSNARLDVDGAMKVGTTASGTAGIVRFSGSDFEGYMGGEWVSLTTGSGGSSGSADKIYEGDTSVECTDAGTGNIEWKIDNNRVMYADYANGLKLFNTGADIKEFSSDTTLGDNSDDAVPTEKAIKTYVDAATGVKVPTTTASSPGTTNLTTGDFGETFVYTATSGTHTYNLPSVSSGDVGGWFRIARTGSGGTVTISGADSDYLDEGSWITTVSGAEIGANITLQLMTETQWSVTGATGWWEVDG